METTIIILNEKGQLDSILTDSESNIKVLKRGKDDDKIDQYEASLDVVDI
jgi:hypothetical protein